MIRLSCVVAFIFIISLMFDISISLLHSTILISNNFSICKHSIIPAASIILTKCHLLFYAGIIGSDLAQRLFLLPSTCYLLNMELIATNDI